MEENRSSRFDEAVERRGSGSYKWDSAERDDMIPLWVADMDFRTADVIIDALRRRVEHGVFGYTLVGEDYYEALIGWFRERHGYEIARERVIYTSGVVPALSAIIKGLTRPGDGVIVQTPVYNCFFSSIRNNGCEIVENPLVREEIDDELFTYRMDYEGLEEVCSRDSSKLLLLCNPHNPAGRAWGEDELRRVAEICGRHGVRVVSDEIHCELTMPSYRYTPYGRIDGDAIVCVSPSKGFNTAGLQIANIVAPDEETRRRIDRAINDNEVCDVNPFGVEALKAAYSAEGAEWLDELRDYLEGNYRMLREMLREGLRGCKITLLEATYLPWIDVRWTGLSSDEIEELLKEREGVWVNSGDMYGVDGYVRVNIACPRWRLREGVRRIIGAIGGYQNGLSGLSLGG